MKLPDPLRALFLVLIPLLLLAGPSWGNETSLGPDLIEAAQKKDLERIKKLIDQGADVNFKSRYGATALFYATGNGDLQMTRLLLAKGAEVNLTDSFYQATPLTRALYGLEESEGHLQVALEILKRKPDDAGAALGFAARAGNLDLVKAAIATGKAEPKEIQTAHDQAKAADKTEITAFLAEYLPEQEKASEPTIELTAEQRKALVGEFKNAEIELKIKVFIDDNVLKAEADGQSPLTLDAKEPLRFVAREYPNIKLTFRGRGGLIEGFHLDQGARELFFSRFVKDDKKTEAVAANEELPPLPKAERGEPINWPSFRGANAAGIGDGQGVPSDWDGETGRNVLWKVPIPGIALSSPVVWDNHIFVTTAESKDADTTFRTGLYGDVDSVDDDSVHQWKLYALDKATGKVRWSKTAATGAPRVERHLKSSHANPSPATDGTHVVAHFATEGLYCYDFEGNLLWKKDLGVLNSGWFYDASFEWGFSASPIIHDGRVILQTDIQKGSYIAAFDIKTGKELWRTARDEIPTWGTPSISPASTLDGIDEVVTNGTTVRGYNAETGEELWTLSPNSEITVGTPVVDDGIAFVTGGYPPARPIYAVKHGARGDLTLAEGETSNEHIAWSVNPGGTYIPSPIVYRGILYMIHNNGRMAAYDAKTGELYYRKRVGSAASYSGSPVAADGRLFITTEEGATHMVRAGKTYQHLGTNELGEVVMTSPAISDGMLLIRGIDHLYAIGVTQKTAEAEAAGYE